MPWSEGAEVRSNLVFLVDVSGSMNAPDKLELLKTSLKMLSRQLSEDDSISIVVYAGASGVVLQPTPGNATVAITQALDQLGAGGSTNGAAGIQLAYNLAQQQFIEGGGNYNDHLMEQLAATSAEYRFSAAVAGFAQLLRDNAALGAFGYADVLALATSARSDDAFGYRSEFINLVKTAQVQDTRRGSENPLAY